MLRVPGVGFGAAFARGLGVAWGGTLVHVIGRADLIAAKRAAGREKDLRDLQRLELDDAEG